MGQGIEPQSYHPIAEKLRDDEVERLFQTIRDNIAQTVATLPEHQAYVARYCGAEEPKAA